MKIQIVGAVVLLVGGFFAGRLSFDAKNEMADSAKSQAKQVSSEGSEVAARDAGPVGSSLPEAAIATPDSATPARAEICDSNSRPIARAESNLDCLARVSRRELHEWMALQRAAMSRFQKDDRQFPSRNQLSAADWKRVQDFGGIKGTIDFKFESALGAEFEIDFKNSSINMSARYRGANATDSKDFSTSSGSATLRNGSGVGLTADGSGYHVVFDNSVDAPVWVDYSHFALSVPYDWDRKTEIATDVFGLSEKLKWEVVGSARLKRALD